ncbi:MAG: protein kinase [Bryobacterales bacterium]|nr:protein kinase [Bryobacterales bacterium]
MQAFQSGDVISRYRITRPLGRGGMGMVYLAEDTRLHRPVALKFLPAEALQDADKQRFLNEAQAAAMIRHPNICPVYDVEEVDGQMFLAMAYLEGETLAHRIARGRLETREAADIAIQVANGLAKAHELGVVHRDIKSGNIMVGPDGNVSILDFGLALRPGSLRLTVEGKTVGTPAYMSPEQARGLPVDERTDIWSLGVVLYEMLTGALPFEGANALSLGRAIVTEETPSLRERRPDAPRALEEVIRTALAKAPEKRWRTARQMAVMLERAAGGREPLATTVAASPVQAPRRWKVPVAVVALLLLLAVAGWWWRGQHPSGGAVPVTGVRQENLVAVLPFEVIGTAPGLAEIANGLMEVLTAAISDFERAHGKVAAVPSSEIRRRSIGSPEEARRVYGANLALEGSARPAGKKLQFTLALVDTATLRQVAARVLEYDPRNPVDARNRAVEELARLLSVNVEEARKTVSGGDTSAPGAYSAYLRGRGLLARYDIQGNLDKAIAQFREAIREDPNYALAYAGLGEACWRKSRAEGDPEMAAQAVKNAERAVQLEPGIPIVHTTLGAIYGTSGREEEAIRELKEALKLAPGNAEAPRELGRVYVVLGRFQEAEAAYLQATRARPTDWYGFLLLAAYYYQQERYEEAETALEQAKQLAPNNELILRNLGMVYYFQGRYAQAVSELQQSLKLKSNATTYGTLAATFYLQHRFVDALSAIETAIDLDANRYFFWGNLGIYCKWTPGNEGKSASAFHKAIELGQKFLQVTPNDYDVRANLAEYKARLGDKGGALAELERIPEAARHARLARLAIVYELTGNRRKAVELLIASVKNPATLHQIEDDPDLAGLWADPELQRAIGKISRTPSR